MIRPEPKKKANGQNTLTHARYQEFADNYRWTEFDERYNEFLSGSDVVLVGPSPSLTGSGAGSEIDERDLVVRVNRGYPVAADVSGDIGSRTDIHYHCFHEAAKCGGPIHYQQMSDDGVYVCCPYPRYVAPFDKDVERFERNKRDLRSHYIDTELYLGCAVHITTRINSGIGAILDLLAHDVKSLYVTGFTFFKDGWRKSYKDEKLMEPGWEKAQFSGNHYQEPQMDAIRNIFDGDDRLELDDAMRRVMEC